MLKDEAPRIFVADTNVVITEGLPSESAYLGVLQQASVLKVMEIIEDKNSIIRGRTKYGWVSIIDAKTGFSWLRRRGERMLARTKRKALYEVMPEDKAPGIFVVDSDVVITVDSQPESAQLGVIKSSSIIKVTEIVEDQNSSIIRGKTKYGWVPIIDTKTGFCWLRKR